MQTNLNISLDKRRSKNDGTFPIIMRLSHFGKTTSIPLNVSVHAKDWDSKGRKVRNSYTGKSSTQRLNNRLQRKKTDAMEVIMDLDKQGRLKQLSITALKELLVNDRSANSFFEFASKTIAELRKAKRYGTAKSYEDVVAVVKAFHGEQRLTFEEISYDFLNRFEAYHLDKGNSWNGLAAYMRTIRAIYNRGIKAGLVEASFYPFSNYKIKTVPTQKRALEWNELKKIIALELPQDHALFHTRNYFVASYLMYGMNFTDMALLKTSDITGERIRYRRAKTSKLYDIKITPALKEILSHYLKPKSGQVYVFPIIKRQHSSDQYKDIKWARKNYNTKLVALGQLADIDQHLTSYVSRHSFATQAMMMEVPINAISTMLGHSDLKTTEVYLKTLPTNILDDFNERLTSGL